MKRTPALAPGPLATRGRPTTPRDVTPERDILPPSAPAAPWRDSFARETAELIRWMRTYRVDLLVSSFWDDAEWRIAVNAC